MSIILHILNKGIISALKFDIKLAQALTRQNRQSDPLDFSLCNISSRRAI